MNTVPFVLFGVSIIELVKANSLIELQDYPAKNMPLLTRQRTDINQSLSVETNRTSRAKCKETAGFPCKVQS